MTESGMRIQLATTHLPPPLLPSPAIGLASPTHDPCGHRRPTTAATLAGLTCIFRRSADCVKLRGPDLSSPPGRPARDLQSLDAGCTPARIRPVSMHSTWVAQLTAAYRTRSTYARPWSMIYCRRDPPLDRPGVLRRTVFTATSAAGRRALRRVGQRLATQRRDRAHPLSHQVGSGQRVVTSRRRPAPG
jgi:hypothetical protein